MNFIRTGDNGKLYTFYPHSDPCIEFVETGIGFWCERKRYCNVYFLAFGAIMK